jgi:hypothetical protein
VAENEKVLTTDPPSDPPRPIAAPGHPIVPTHSQLSKDHGDHPLHELAAECAGMVAKSIAKYAIDNWTAGKRGDTEIERLCQIANGYIFHPVRWEDTPDAEIKANRQRVLDHIKEWVAKPKSRTALLTVASTAWQEKQSRKIKDTLDSIQKRRLQVLGLVTKSPEKYVSELESRVGNTVKMLSKQTGNVLNEPKRVLKNVQTSIVKNIPSSVTNAKDALVGAGGSATGAVEKAGVAATAAVQNAIPGAAKAAGDLGSSAAGAVKNALPKPGKILKGF